MEDRRRATRRGAIVTAAGGGIGRAVVQRLLRDGWQVCAIDRSAAALDELAAGQSGAALDRLAGDMTAPEDVARIFAAIAPLGPMQLLVNGVGSTCDSPLATLTLPEWRRLFDLNLTSVLLCTQAALPLLRAADGDRAIINLSSTLATVADPTTLAYGAFKAALDQWTRSLALELAPARIRVVGVAPGPVAATGGEAAYETDDYARLNPLGRFATPAEVAALIGFLAAPEAAYLTGVTIRLDGGDSALGIGWGPLRALLDAERHG